MSASPAKGFGQTANEQQVKPVPPSNNQQNINQLASLASVVGQVGCLVILLVGLALGAGLFLDRLLDTKPIFTVVLMVGSVPLALYLTVRVSLAAVTRAQRGSEVVNNPSSEDSKAT